MIMRIASVLVPALLFIGVVEANNTTIKCPACLYEQEEEDGCWDYSQSASGTEIKPWPKANDFCLANLGIEERIMDLGRFWAICPFPNVTDAGYTEIVNFLQAYPDHPISHEIKSLFSDTGLFVQSPTGSFVLPESIITQPQQQFLNCTLSAQFCWGEVRIQLEGYSGKTGKLCENLHKLQVEALKKEQSLARLKLCQDGPVQQCGELSDMVQQDKPFGGDCNPFGITIPKDALPDCSGSDIATSASTRSAMTLVGLMLVVLSAIPAIM